MCLYVWSFIRLLMDLPEEPANYPEEIIIELLTYFYISIWFEDRMLGAAVRFV